MLFPQWTPAFHPYLQAALLTGNTSLLPQPAASQLAAANTSVVGQGAAQGTAATAMEEDDDDDVTEAGEGEEDEGEEVEQGRQAHVHGSSATVQQAKTLRGMCVGARVGGWVGGETR
jgi:hypothetical protein